LETGVNAVIVNAIEKFRTDTVSKNKH